jgi:hypothetical protein
MVSVKPRAADGVAAAAFFAAARLAVDAFDAFFVDFLLLLLEPLFLERERVAIAILLYPSRSRLEGSSCEPLVRGRSSSSALRFSLPYSASLTGRPMGTDLVVREGSAGAVSSEGRSDGLNSSPADAAPPLAGV